MKIRIAEYCGFCYGVKRAVDMAYKLAEANEASGTFTKLLMQKILLFLMQPVQMLKLHRKKDKLWLRLVIYL